MTFTLGQAAKQAGVSKPTLARWIHRGRISADKNDDGSYLIDASELDRIAELKQLARNRASHGDKPRHNILAHRQFWCTRVRPPRSAWTGKGREETERGPPASSRGQLAPHAHRCRGARVPVAARARSRISRGS